MDADQLRELSRAFIPWLDEATQARVINEGVDRAARESGGWAPKAPTDQRVEEIKSFAAAMRLNHEADPSEVNDCLRDGTHAFLAREYALAFRIFRALLIPLAEGDIDLGHYELIDEALGVDVHACAAQYVAAMYMTASPSTKLGRQT